MPKPSYFYSIQPVKEPSPPELRNSELQFITGQRGCLLLFYNDFKYVRNRRSGLKTYWICATKGSTKCNARCVTDVVNGVERVVLDSCHHNHEKQVARKKRSESKPNTKKTALVKTEDKEEEMLLYQTMVLKTE